MTGLIGPLLLVAVMGAATYSVVRYRLAIVAAYTAAAAALAGYLVARQRGHLPSPTRWAPAAALVLAAAVIWSVPAFSYLAPGPQTLLRYLLAATAVVSAVVLASPLARAGDGALAVAIAGYLIAAVALLRLDPAPSIDVWYTLQGAADSLAAGRNIYREVWVGPPGVMAAFTYLPWTAVLLAPGRWLAGDVRVALVVVSVAAALCLRAAAPAGPRRQVAAGFAALLLLLPGTATQVEQAWTEPLLLACLAGAALAVCRGRIGVAIALFALGLACKQHLALLLPLLAAWPRFGPRRALATAAAAGALVLPWLVADPRAFVGDTVMVGVGYPPLLFSDSLYVAAINELGWLPPFWLTGAVVVSVLALICVRLHRTDPEIGQWLLWAALALLLANLVNKQAFYNQYWLVAALLVLGWAIEQPADLRPRSRREPGRPAVPTATAGPRR
jgi:hypothetical protein